MIGVDFDNTIVRYDDVFGRVALDLGLVPPEAATSKTAVRDHLRAAGQEDRWTELQGIIYGPRMMDAGLFAGVAEFFARCRATGTPVAIVSHRTRHPYLGERHDLHAAARDFLARHGFHEEAGIGLPKDRVFFEETKEEKLARIAAAGCTTFIDDLPELLADPRFPTGVRRILFDPGRLHAPPQGVESAASWGEVEALLGGGPSGGTTASMGRGDLSPASVASVMAAAGLPPAVMIDRLSGGGNNRVYRVDSAAGPVLLKKYFQHAADPRDRLGAEQAFSRFAWDHGVRALPQPLGCDREAGLGLYEFIVGRKLAPGEVLAQHVDEASAFFADVNHHRDDPASAELPLASESCFSLAEHLACVDRRMARLATISRESDQHREAVAVVTERLLPAWTRARAAVAAEGEPLHAPLSAAARAISPSDFGFHNCIATDAGMKFIDFEYAGWDDPAKVVCDFFCQPAVPVPREHFPRFLQAVADAVGDPDLPGRVALLLPVYELKWCCIMLNEFLPMDDRRRVFAGAVADREARRGAQLTKVAAALDRIGA